ncbi:MAG: YbhN family protein [Bacilli bacterium]
MKISKEIKNKLNILLLIVVTIIVLYISLKDNFFEVINGLTKLNLFWIVIALIFVMGYYFFRTLSLHTFVTKFKNIPFNKIFKIVFITQFFDGITPSSSGGQPYQIYAFKKENIHLVDATNIAIQNFIVYQIALVLLGLIAVILNKYLNLFNQLGIIKNLIMLGFIINVIVIVGLFSLAFMKKLNKIIMKLIVKILAKLKIIKASEKIIDKLNESIEEFHEGAKTLLKNKKDFIKTIFFNFVALLLFYSIPVIIIFGLGDYQSINVLESIIASAHVMLIGTFIPIPGATGGLEYAFTQFYGVFITGSTLTLVMLLWRSLTYYLGVIIGGVLLNIRKKR